MRSKQSQGITLAVVSMMTLLGAGWMALHSTKAGAGSLPEGAGLAAKYPGGVGIERDPDVLFAENFESGTIDEIAKRWGNMNNKDGKVMTFSDDVPPQSAGKRSLQMTATLGENTGGHLYTRLR